MLIVSATTGIIFPFLKYLLFLNFYSHLAVKKYKEAAQNMANVLSNYGNH
jgi:hypothetical protein